MIPNITIHLLSIIAISVGVAIFFAELSGIPDTIKKIILPVWHRKTLHGLKLPRRIKPFDCHLCLSFWICLYLCVYQDGMDWQPSIVLSCISSVVSVGVMKMIR